MRETRESKGVIRAKTKNQSCRGRSVISMHTKMRPRLMSMLKPTLPRRWIQSTYLARGMEQVFVQGEERHSFTRERDRAVRSCRGARTQPKRGCILL